MNNKQNTNTRKIVVGLIASALLFSIIPTQSFAETRIDHSTLMYVVNESGNTVSVFNTACEPVDLGNGSGVFIPIGNDLWNPRGMVFDEDGNAYLSSSTRDTILKYDKNGSFIEVFVDDGRLSFPQGMTFDDKGNLYIASTGNDKVIRYNQEGDYIDDFVPADGKLKKPEDVKFGSDGLFYVSSGGTDEVLRYDAYTGEFVDVFADRQYWLFVPADMVFSEDGTKLYVVSSWKDRVNIYDVSTKEYLGGIEAEMGYGVGSVDIGPDGFAYIPSFFRNSVDKFDVDTKQFVGNCISSNQDLSKPITILFHTQSIDTNPIADAGSDMTIKLGEKISLDGTGSHDPLGRTLSYNWTKVSNEEFTGSDSAQPEFVLPAIWEFQLVVSAGGQSSQPDTVKITLLP
jgi:sugar lactone lactonase YvrE